MTATDSCGTLHDIKTTIEIPDGLFRDAKAAAVGRGISLKTFFTEALKEKLATPRARRKGVWPVAPPKVAKGVLLKLHRAIARDFSIVDQEALASGFSKGKEPVRSKGSTPESSS
ncbi:MAG: hypothetical protein AB7O66_04000 [Limisphaerales bacterium]